MGVFPNRELTCELISLVGRVLLHRETEHFSFSNMVLATALLIALLSVFVHNGEALYCWECTGDNDLSCNDPFDPSVSKKNIRNCDPYMGSNNLRNHYVCRKSVKLVGEEKKRVVDRSCVLVSDTEPYGPCSPQSLSNTLHLDSCKICDTNECNSAPGLSIISTLILLPTTLITIKQL